MPLSVLNDDDVRLLLENLTVDELERFKADLGAALHQYSTGNQQPGVGVGQGSIHQPERISVTSDVTGATTLFMPSCSPSGHGIKGVFLACLYKSPVRC